MNELAQMTLTGDETDEERVVPDTFRYCPRCDERVLRSREHPHTVYGDEEAAQTAQNDSASENDATPSYKEEDDDEPEQVGRWYTVEMSYNMVYSVRIPAQTKRQAKELAEEKKREDGLEFTDGHHVHTNVDRGSTIYEDDDAADEHNLHL